MPEITPDYEEDSSDPFIEQSLSGTPFEHDPHWTEAPACMWTPEFENNHMPIREPTPAELADTERKRGGSEDETCPIDPLLQNLDFTSEYISPKELDKDRKEYLHKYYDCIKYHDDGLTFLDEEEETW